MERLVYKLPVFEGPLDALLFLISKNKLNIYDIPISELLSQYLAYLNTLREMDLEVTSDFLEMASKLVQIKSSMLLPRHEEEDDPRDELVTALIGYQTCKAMAEALRRKSVGFDCFVRKPMPIEHDDRYKAQHPVSELTAAYFFVRGRVRSRRPPPVSAFQGVVGRRIVSVTSRIVHVVRMLVRQGTKPLSSFFEDSAGRSEAVATFLAVLELIKTRRILIEETHGEETVRMIGREGKHWKSQPHRRP